jgi:hypothetical protein
LGPEKQFQMSVQRDLPAGGIQKRGQHLDGGSLPGSVRAEEGENLARPDRKRNIFDRGKIAELLDQILDLDHGNSLSEERHAILNGTV